MYGWVGFWRVEVVPSPKFHAHELGEFVDVSVNKTVRGASPVVGVTVKFATGGYTGALTVIRSVIERVSLPPVLMTVKLTVYVPGFWYWWEGFCVVEVPPSPKVHFQEVGASDDVSMNRMMRGAVPPWGVAVKFAFGAEGVATRMKFDRVIVLLPPALVAVRLTV
jgi:hypothetical protein